MRNKALFVLLWLSLFGATVGISAVASRSDPDKRAPDGQSATDVIRSTADDLLMIELDSIPRISVIYATSATEFDLQLSTFIKEHSDGLRQCRTSIVSRSRRPKEFLEVSFLVSPDPLSKSAGTGTYHAKLEEIVLERSTAMLEPDDRECVVKAFQQFRPLITGHPKGRYPYRFCVGAKI